MGCSVLPLNCAMIGLVIIVGGAVTFIALARIARAANEQQGVPRDELKKKLGADE